MTDLRDQLRQAATIEERCEAVNNFVGTRDLTINEARKLYDIIDLISVGILPAALLLGVVAAMVPEEHSLGISVPCDADSCAIVRGARYGCGDARSPECAMAIAILEAKEATNA